MTDLLYIFESENTEEPSFDLFVALSWATAFFSMVAMLIFGLYPPVNTALIVAPLAFVVMLVGAQAVYNNLIYSYASNTLSAALWTIPQTLILFLGAGAFGGSLNVLGDVYVAPIDSGGYLNTVSVLNNLSPAMQAIFNNRLAPIVETFALVALTYVLARLALEADLDQSLPGGKLSLGILISIPGSVIFGWIHGVVTFLFFLKAFTVMFVSLAVLFAEELTQDDKLPIAVTTALIASIHAGLNLHEFGGYTKYLETLLTAQAPQIYISYMWLLFEATLWIATAMGIGAKLYEVAFE